MAKKKVAVGGGYELRFDQRAKGQETPYYVGTIFKDGQQVGSFNNDGNGGMTFIHPQSAVTDFQRMVDETAKKLGYDASKDIERESEVIEFGAAIDKSRGKMVGTIEKHWEEWVKQMIASNEAFRKKYGK